MSDDILKFIKWPREIDEHEGLVLYSLRNYQIIEVVLKSYLCRPSGLRMEDVKNKAMGNLLKEFIKVNNNFALHSLLEVVRSDRNQVAHQSLVIQNPDTAKILGATPLSLEVLRAIDRRAMKAMTDLVCEFIRTEP